MGLLFIATQTSFLHCSKLVVVLRRICVRVGFDMRATLYNFTLQKWIFITSGSWYDFEETASTEHESGFKIREQKRCELRLWRNSDSETTRILRGIVAAKELVSPKLCSWYHSKISSVLQETHHTPKLRISLHASTPSHPMTPPSCCQVCTQAPQAFAG